MYVLMKRESNIAATECTRNEHSKVRIGFLNCNSLNINTPIQSVCTYEKKIIY